jgi:SAM-dependent methyltransferase
MRATTRAERNRPTLGLPIDAGALVEELRSRVLEECDYVAEARKAAGRTPGAPASGPVVELGVGTGRIAVPIALAGVPVIGVDTSAGMLAVCRTRAEEAGVADLLDLRVGDFRTPPVSERVPLVICPFGRTCTFRTTTRAPCGARDRPRAAAPGRLLAFDVFTPSPEDVEETHGRSCRRLIQSVPRGESVAASTPVAGPLTPSSARRSSA